MCLLRQENKKAVLFQNENNYYHESLQFIVTSDSFNLCNSIMEDILDFWSSKVNLIKDFPHITLHVTCTLNLGIAAQHKVGRGCCFVDHLANQNIEFPPEYPEYVTPICSLLCHNRMLRPEHTQSQVLP